MRNLKIPDSGGQVGVGGADQSAQSVQTKETTQNAALDARLRFAFSGRALPVRFIAS